jgi:hypothetical protein
VFGFAWRTFARAWRAALIVISLPFVPGLLSATFSSHEANPRVLSRRAETHYAWARKHLEEPFHGYGVLDDMGAQAFDVVILSHLASGLMNVGILDSDRRTELQPLIREVARRAISAEVSPTNASATQMELGDHNLYASHLLLILGVAHHLGVDEHDALAMRLARHLRGRSLSSRDFHARSYPGSPRWPADQSVTLAGLRLHDHEHGTTFSERPIAGWLAWLERHRTSELPWSATGGLAYTRIPRGCALSWMTGYMAQFAPDEGAQIYRTYRAEHGISFLGYRGFREWPRGHDGGSDIDAGPVIFGWGTAATGIGLGAARLYGDAAQWAGIERTADTVGLPIPGNARYLLAPTLGQAILFAGETATFWFDRPEIEPTLSEWPVGPLLFLVGLVLFQLWLVRGIWRVGS